MAKLTLEDWAVEIAKAATVPRLEMMRRAARKLRDAGLRDSVLDLLASRQNELEGWAV